MYVKSSKLYFLLKTQMCFYSQQWTMDEDINYGNVLTSSAMSSFKLVPEAMMQHCTVHLITKRASVL